MTDVLFNNLDVQLMAVKIYFKAQNVKEANYSPPDWKCSPFFMVVDVELYYWEKLVQIELEDMYSQI